MTQYPHSVLVFNCALPHYTANKGNTLMNSTTQIAQSSVSAHVVKALGNIALSIVNLALIDGTLDTLKAKRKEVMAGLEEAMKTLRSNRVVFGKSRRTCAYTEAIFQGFVALDVKPATAANYLSAFKICYTEKRAFTLNVSREKAKEAGLTQTIPSKPAPAQLTANVAGNTQQTKALPVHTEDDVRHAPETDRYSKAIEAAQKAVEGLSALQVYYKKTPGLSDVEKQLGAMLAVVVASSTQKVHSVPIRFHASVMHKEIFPICQAVLRA